ncbi:hypothetical protein FFI89_019640 [Bradyrhizobium sp. KBS0727]|uniref:hypothetical protein n=1 Tax=unclassified Bradyrhizobium TaxID=2631580 RepID=UPI00110F01EB|nr:MULTISPECIES: hypothetical protein [unclassified Bradyrhizobium]QDW39164.1 hypothetical protein FFI71_019645 [Bradyrhizobium sp. KBS0725]QDW45767.1 hypothetical protein FFI89_019640 [Bradyrhizobium sp. KBS0727]
MQSTPNLRDADPHDVFVIEPNVSLAARADKAPLDQLYDVLSHPSVPRPSDRAPSHVRPDPELRVAPDFSASAAVPSVDAAARGTVADDIPVDDTRFNDIRLGDTEISAHQPATSKFARGAVMSLFAIGSAVAAAAWQHYGDDAKAMFAQYTPPFSLASSASVEKPATSEQPAAAAVQAAESQPAETAAPATASAALVTASAAPVTAAAPDQTQVIQSMARDLAAMGQQINELKASIEQIKAGQAQMAGAPARTTEARLAEPAPRPRVAPPPPVHASTAPVRRPKQVFPYAPIAPAPVAPQPQTAAAPAPLAPQAQAAEAADGGPVVRPPMPLR